jgi:uncharacterized damage-inducible protein DinB
MTEDRDDLLRHYRLSRARLLAAVEGLGDAELSEPSLDGWAVKDHFAHIALWDDLRAAEVERISAGYESAWNITDERDDALNVSGYEARRSLSAAQARWELETSRRRLLDAIAGATPRGLDDSLYGAAGLRSDHEDDHAGWIERWRSERRG